MKALNNIDNIIFSIDFSNSNNPFIAIKSYTWIFDETDFWDSLLSNIVFQYLKAPEVRLINVGLNSWRIHKDKYILISLTINVVLGKLNFLDWLELIVSIQGKNKDFPIACHYNLIW